MANASQRYFYYQKLLGRTDGQIQTDVQSNIASMDPIDTGGLQNLNFSQAGDSGEPEMAIRQYPRWTSPRILRRSSDGEIKTLSTNEAEELRHAMATGLRISKRLRRQLTSGQELSSDSAIWRQVQPMGGGVDVTFGGVQFGVTPMSMMASSVRKGADNYSYQAKGSEKLG